MLMQKVFGTGGIHFLLPGMIALFCYLSVAQEKKIKYYHLMTIPTDKKKIVAGENYLYWVHDFVF